MHTGMWRLLQPQQKTGECQDNCAAVQQLREQHPAGMALLATP